MRCAAAVMIALLAAALLSGCNGARETDEVAWVVTMGIDKAADGELLVTYRIAVPQAAGGEGGGGEKKEPSELVTIKAATLAEARNILNASLSRGVSLSHSAAIVIGEDLARSGVRDVISPLLRFREFRGSTFVIVARGQAREIMKRNKPPIEALVSRWVQNYMSHYKEVGYYLPLTLHEFYIRLKAVSGTPLAAVYAANPLTGKTPASGQQPGDHVRSYLPGDLPRQGGNPTEIVGVAVFKEDKLAGYLDTGETRALAILANKFPAGFVVVDDPLEPKRLINVSLRNGRPPKVAVDIGGARPVVKVDVFLEGEITAVPSGINYEDEKYLQLMETKVADALQEEIMRMLLRTQAWGTDVADFGYYVRPKFFTLGELKEYGWNQRFADAVFEVAVRTEIRRFGLLRKTTPIRRD